MTDGGNYSPITATWPAAELNPLYRRAPFADTWVGPIYTIKDPTHEEERCLTCMFPHDHVDGQAMRTTVGDYKLAERWAEEDTRVMGRP